MTTKKPNPMIAKPKYEPTSQEQTVIARHRARKSASEVPRLKVLTAEGSATISLDHPDQAIGAALLMEGLGTADADFLTGLLRQLAAASGLQIDEQELSFMLAAVKGIKPRDELEAMLATQMAAIHMATMRSARHLAGAENIPQQDSAERALNKLARTYTTQMETLKRYRSGGEQTVTVQQVSVSEGGQAVVGNVTQAPRASAPAEATETPMPAMTIQR
jgi:hypothetical protein